MTARLHAALFAIVLPVCFGYSLGAALGACKEYLPDPSESDDLNMRLSDCRGQARAAKEAGADPTSAYMKYEDCKRVEQIEGVDAR